MKRLRISFKHQTKTPITMSFKFFIQARMSSKRLPGKVLLPFLGKTVIENIVNTVGKEHTVVVTSNDETDNILAEKLISLDIETTYITSLIDMLTQ